MSIGFNEVGRHDIIKLKKLRDEANFNSRFDRVMDFSPPYISIEIKLPIDGVLRVLDKCNRDHINALECITSFIHKKIMDEFK